MFSTIRSTDYEIQYRDIIQSCLSDEAVYREDRTGVGCYSVFNKQIDIEVGNKFPVITGRKMFAKVFNTEMLWFLNGETNIQRFKDAGVKIWDAWADEDGELGPVYGHQLRNFSGRGYDQLESVIDSLKNDPDSRRHVISLWNPVQLEYMALPPCYLYFQFFVENGKLNMFVVQRSGDMYLGVPYDNYAITSFGRTWSFKTKKFIKGFYRPNSVIFYMNSTSNVKMKELFKMAGWKYKHSKVCEKLLSYDLLVNDYRK